MPDEKKSGTKIALEAISNGFLAFAATNGVATACVPNPVTGAAAAISTGISAATRIAASRMD